jgi:hypothetical protein
MIIVQQQGGLRGVTRRKSPTADNQAIKEIEDIAVLKAKDILASANLTNNQKPGL